METVQFFKGLFEGYDKTVLAYRSWRPVFCEKVCVIIHGLGEYSARYEHMAQAFSNEATAFYAYDQRGHGESKGLRGHAPSFHHLTSDLEKFLKLVSIHENGKPLYIFAHSFGALVCLKYLIECYEEKKECIFPKALIVSNPMIQLALKVPTWKLKMARTVATLMPTLQFYNEVRLSDLSQDPEVEKKYKTDPLCHQKISAGLYFETRKAMKEVREKGQLISVPTFVLLGDHDRVIDHQGGKDLFTNIQGTEHKLKIYPNFRHELVNEIGKETVFSDIREWLNTLNGR